MNNKKLKEKKLLSADCESKYLEVTNLIDKNYFLKKSTVL